MASRFEVSFTVNNFPRIRREAQAKTRDVVSRTLTDLKNDIIKSFGGAKHGRTYSRAGRIHVASAPGEAPAVDTGAYAASWQTEIEGDGLGGAAFTNDPKGPLLELGTSRMSARPHVVPALERIRTPFLDAMAKIFEG